MFQRISSSETAEPRPPAASPPAVVVIAIVWLTFACALPFYQLREARRQAHQDLLHVLMIEKPDKGSVIDTFDRSNKNLDAAASGPCLIFAVTSIVLINQLLKLKRRYNALVQDASFSNQRRDSSD